MRLIITSLGICTSLLAIGQITIGQNDMPAVNDTLRYHVAQPTMDGDVVSTGPGVTWDFSMLMSMAGEADITVPVASTPLLYQFYFNNQFLYPDHVASFAVEGMDFNFQLLTVENVYEYFRNTATGYFNVGFGAMINGLPSSVRRQPRDRIFAFPLAYSNVDSSFSAWNINVPNTFYFEQEQWRHNTVDGWGTLYLPADTFEVLRVRSVLNRHDSIYVSQFGTGFGFDEPETVEYKWLAQGMGRPVLEIITVGGAPVSIQYYRSDDIGTSIASEEHVPSLVMYPNPVKDLLHFRSPEPVSGHMQVRDMQGRVVLTSAELRGITNWQIPVNALPNGNYTIELEGMSPWQGRFVVAH